MVVGAICNSVKGPIMVLVKSRVELLEATEGGSLGNRPARFWRMFGEMLVSLNWVGLHVSFAYRTGGTAVSDVVPMLIILL